MSRSTPEFLTPQDVADRTQLSYRTVLRAVEAGELAGVKLRGRVRIPVAAYEQWLTDSTLEPVGAVGVPTHWRGDMEAGILPP